MSVGRHLPAMIWTGLLIGILFGFAMQRSDFCGASLLSSVVLFRDRQGIAGICVAVFVSMLGFGLLAQADWIIPNPNPMCLLSAVVGGAVFGTGMVLAGGCVTGTLYKAGEGRLTSILALVGIGIGANVVGGGLLAPAKRALVRATRELSAPAGLSDALELPFPLVAGVVGGLGILATLVIWRRPPRAAQRSWKSLIRGGWSAVTGGIVIIGWLAYLSSTASGRNYPLGGVYGLKTAFAYLWGGKASGGEWLMLQCAGILLGSTLSARLRKQWSLRSADPATLLVALLGGLLVGAGAMLARGCFTGNVVSGLALLSLHSALFALFTVLANFVTTYFYLRGTR